MSIESEITRIKEGVNDVKSAITQKGGTVPSGAKINNLGDAVRSIPSGEPVPPAGPSQYGRVTYCKNKKVVVNGELRCDMCTAEIVDADKFSDFMSQQQDAHRLDMMYEQGEWRLNWETIVEDPLEEMGMQIELDEGADFAMISGNLKGSYYGKTIYDFESLDEIDGLCNVGVKTIDGQMVASEAILDFEWGTTTPTEIGDYFMDNSSWSSPSIPKTVESIGHGFLNSAKIPSNSVIELDGNSSLQNIGGNFCTNATLGYLSINTANNLTVGNNFCSYAKIARASFGSPISFGNYFLECSIIGVLSVSSNSFANVTSTGNYFLAESKIMEADKIISAMTNLTDIGEYFCGGSYGPTSVTIPSTVTSVGTGFLVNCKTISIVKAEASAHPTDESSLAFTTSTSSPSYTRGILMTGTYAQTWKNALPNSTSAPYRKLVLK